MMRFKRIMSFLLALTLLAGMMPPVHVHAEETETAETMETVETAWETTVETTEATEETAGPAETTVAATETQPTEEQTLPEETTVPVQTVASETEPVPEFVEVISEKEPEEREALFEQYVLQLFYGKKEASGTLARNQLTGADRALYDVVKPVIEQIAAGNRTSTVVEVDFTGTGYYAGDVSTRLVAEALEYDCPYDMYWFRSMGMGYGSATVFRVFLYPAKNFQPANYDSSNPTVDTSMARKAKTAAANAKSIVSSYASYSDYNKIGAYVDKICSLVEYDHYAADNDIADVDITPWTLINTFDNDPSTNIVCEGYSVSFQYLCDLSTFQSDVRCYIVRGYTSGYHQWNIVRIDGHSYFMDVTGCDGGTQPHRGAFFLSGPSGHVVDGYAANAYNFYTYSDETMEIWGFGSDSILRLASTQYKPGVTPSTPATMTQSAFQSALNSCGGSYRLSKKVTLTSDMNISGVRLTIASGGMLVVGSGVELTLQDNASITVSTGGELCVNKRGVLFQYGTITDNGGWITEEGILCATAEDYIRYLAYNNTGMTAAQIRQKAQAVDVAELTEILIQRDEYSLLMLAVEKLEKAVGGPVAVAVSDAVTDFGKYFDESDVTVEGASLNTPRYSYSTMTMQMDTASVADASASAAFSLYLDGAKNGTQLDFPVKVTLSLPSGMLSQGAVLRHRRPDGTVVSLKPQSAGTYAISFATTTLGDFYLIYDSSGTCGTSATWNLNMATGTMTISGKGKVSDYSSFTRPPWYSVADKIKKVVVQKGITEIGKAAFEGCKNLEAIVLPEGLTKLGDDAFSSCGKLKDISLPGTLREVGGSVFDMNDTLEEVTIPGSLTKVGNRMFAACKNLKRVTLEEGVQILDTQAFWICKGLEMIVLPESLTSIGNIAFDGCDSLTQITFKGSVPKFVTDSDGKDRTFGGVKATVYYPANNPTWTANALQNHGGTLTWVPGCTNGHLEVTVKGQPATCTEDGISDGRYCSLCGEVLQKQTTLTALGHNVVTDKAVSATCTDSGLTEGSHCARCGEVYKTQTVIPARGHTEVIDRAVAPTCTQSGWTEGKHCSACQAVLVARQVVPALNHNFVDALCQRCGAIEVLEGTGYDDLHWKLDENGKLTISGEGDMWDSPWEDYVDRIRSVEIRYGVTGIDSWAFENAVNLTEVSIPSTVTEIGSSAFAGCTALTGVVIPRGVTYLGSFLFQDCTALTSVTIPATVTEIGGWAFDGCTGLTSITIPQGVKTLHNSVFQDCTALESVSLPGSLTSVGYSLFAYCESLKSVTLPSSLTEISRFMFTGCTALESITIPSAVKTIGDTAFHGCTSMTTVTIPASVTSIGTHIFGDCANLKTIKVSTSNRYYCSDASGVLYNKAKTSLMQLPGGYQGSYTVPNTVQTIEDMAITSCAGLTAITLPAGLKTIGYAAFRDSSGLKELTIPKGVTVIEEAAFEGCDGLRDVWFACSAPEMGYDIFTGLTVTARYPAGDASWTDAVRQNYQGDVTWIASCINGHAEVIQKAVAATCTEPGMTEGRYCSVCGDVLVKQTVIPALGHNMIKDRDVPATCTTDGYQGGAGCSRCDYTQGQTVIPALGHAEVTDPAAAPTCTETGLTEGKHCSRCSEILIARQTVPALGHTEVVDPAAAPTCTETGLTEGKHCSVCNEILLAQDVIPATGHTYAMGSCRACGEADPAGGVLSDTIGWHVDTESGTLQLSGSGTAAVNGEMPWADFAAQITAVHIGKEITGIDNRVFSGLRSLTQIRVEEENPNYSAEEGILFSRDGTVLVRYPCGRADKAYIVPDRVQRIGDYAFSGCESLRQIQFWGDMPVLEENAFAGLTAEATYPYGNGTWQPERLSACGGSISWLEKGRIVAEGTSAYSLRWQVEANGVLTISGEGEMGNYFPSLGEPAPWYAFADKFSLVVVEDGITSIGYSAFKNCAGIREIRLPESLTKIGGSAFAGCTALETVNLADSIAQIGAYAFQDCASLEQIHVPASLTVLENGTFKGCAMLTELWLPDGIGRIGSWTFDSCSGLREIRLPEELSVLGSYAFRNCRSLEQIRIPETVTVLESSVFYGCRNLTGLRFVGSAPKFDKAAFAGLAVTVSYPGENTTWNTRSMQPYGGTVINWDPWYPVEEVTEIRTTAERIHGGEQATLSVLLDPGIRQDVAVQWDVTEGGQWATLQPKGGIATLTAGDVSEERTVTVTARTEEGGAEAAAITLTVLPRKQTAAAADYTLYGGKSLALKAYDLSTGKALSGSKIGWATFTEREGLRVSAEAMAPITSAGRLTARNVYEKARIWAVAYWKTTGETVAEYAIDLIPAVTQVEMLCDGNVVNGQDVKVDFNRSSVVLTLNAYPEDTAQEVSWNISDSKRLMYARNYEISGNTLTVSGLTRKAGTVTVKATVDAGVKKTVTVRLELGQYAKKLKIAKPEKTEILEGENLKLTAAIVRSGVVSKPGIVWSFKNSTDKNYATLSSTGVLRGKTVYGRQEVTVVATSKDGEVRDEVTIGILPKKGDILILRDGGGRNVTKDTVLVDMNGSDTTVALTAKALNGGYTGSIKWTPNKSSKTAQIRPVGDTLYVTMLKAGSVSVTAADSMGRRATVTVKAVNLTKEVEITSQTGFEVASGKTLSLKAVCHGGINAKANFSIVSGDAYAKITAAGKLTATKDLAREGTVVVRAEAADGSGEYRDVTVKVRPLATGVQVYSVDERTGLMVMCVDSRSGGGLLGLLRSDTTLRHSLAEGSRVKLNSRVYPYYENGVEKNAIQTVNWKSSNEKIAAVDKNGMVTCLKPGTVTITCTAADGSGKKVTMKLQVVQE